MRTVTSHDGDRDRKEAARGKIDYQLDRPQVMRSGPTDSKSVEGQPERQRHHEPVSNLPVSQIYVHVNQVHIQGRET